MILSIGMIVRNEEKNLRACLNGIKPILERVDGELIIADTGSADGTISIAKEFTDKVFQIEWEGDFAKARNATLERAGGEWYMFLDADETFTDTADIIRFFNSGEYKKYGSASHYLIDAGSGARDVFARLYRIDKSTAFTGKIHEQIPIQPPVKRLGGVSVHTGYDFGGDDGREKRAAKHKRNISPLLESHGDAPEDLRVIALIVNEYLSYGELERAAAFIQKGLALRDKSTRDMFYHVLRHYELILLGKAGDFERAAERARDYFDGAKKLFACAINMRLTEGMALGELGRHEAAGAAYEEALSLISGYGKGKLCGEDVMMSVTPAPSPELEKFAAIGAAGQHAMRGNFGGVKRLAGKYGLDMSEGGYIRRAMRSYEDRAAKGVREEARERLNKETAAVKELIYGMIRGGRLADAAGLLEKYAGANPSDPEISVISGIIERALTDPSIPGKVDLMGGVQTVFAISSLTAGGTGVTNSVLRKAMLMEREWGCKPLILVCGHNIELRRTVNVLRNAGDGRTGLSPGARVLNVYEYFQGSYAAGLPDKAVYLDPDSLRDRDTYRETADKGIYDAYEGGRRVRREYYTGHEGALRAVMRVENGRNARLEFYDDWGYLNKACHYDAKDDGRLNRVDFHATGGSVCVRAFYDFKDGENVLNRIVIYDDNGETLRECENDDGLAALCLERLTEDGRAWLIVAEDGLLTSETGRLQKPNARKAIVVHSIFQEDPYDPESRPNAHYKYLCGNPGGFAAIAFLTAAERDDFRAIYGGGSSNLHVIPHPYPYPVIKTDFEKRDHRKAVIVTRFDRVKQIDMAIGIFAAVIRELPDVKLEIYGYGALRAEYEGLIKRLGLSWNVFLAGPAADPAAVFSGAALSMMTSLAEGFPLTPAESVCNGCPAFAFDIKYGPSDIIRDGETGFLFRPFDKEAYALKLIEYFNDARLQKEMSEACYADSGRFGTKAFLDGWFALTEAACKGLSSISLSADFRADFSQT